MSTDLTVQNVIPQNVGSALQVYVETKGKNYTINGMATLVRDVDFGKYGQAKTPSLLKAGAEKVANTLGLMTRYYTESAVENFEGKAQVAFYRVRCELVKGFVQPNGSYAEVVYSSGFGSANTNEKRNGMNDVWNAANSTLKMAQKRALVSAVLGLGLSSMFTQDIEDEVSMKKADLIIKEDPNAPITQPQIKRLFAIMGDMGITQNEAKQKLSALGYASTKAIKQGEYDELIKKLKEGENTNG